MPFQVRGQLVLIKSSKLVHAAGAVTAAAGGAFVTMRSPGDASVAQASARIIAAGTANFFMSPPTQSGDEIPVVQASDPSRSSALARRSRRRRRAVLDLQSPRSCRNSAPRTRRLIEGRLPLRPMAVVMEMPPFDQKISTCCLKASQLSRRRPGAAHAGYARGARQARGKLCLRSRHRAADPGGAVLLLLLRQQQFLQRAFAELAGGGGNAALGGLGRRRRRRQGAGAARRRRVRGLAGFLGLVDLAGTLGVAHAAPASGLLRLRRRRRIDDRRQDMMARHGPSPVALPHLAGDSRRAASYKCVIPAGRTPAHVVPDKPTGRANARPMTGSARSGTNNHECPCCAKLERQSLLTTGSGGYGSRL